MLEFRSLIKLRRFKEIVMTLAKYGFEDLVQRLDLPGMGILNKVIPKTDRELSTYERIRLILEELGPTFVKFGQIMSLRPDMLPQTMIKELSKLQDEVPPVSLPEIKAVAEKSLGRPIYDMFSIFDAEPIAAASLAQVHRAVLRQGGRIVSVKIQRPDIRRKVEADLDILAAIAHRIDERSEDLRTYELPSLVRTTRRILLRELDFTREARNMRIARANQRDSADIYIPKVYEDYCTEHVLVMEYLIGTRLRDLDPEALENRKSLAKQGLGVAIKQILEDGFFHADPHPGNLLITAEKGLCLIDWGMVGRLTQKDRYELIELIRAVVDEDSESLVDALLTVSDSEYEIDRRGLEREISDVLDSHYTASLRELNLGHLLLDITALLRDYRLRLPSDLVIMIKALVTAEGSARLIYPDLDVISEAEKYIRRLVIERYKPQAVWQMFRTSLGHLMGFQRQFPRRFSQIMAKVERGELNVRFQHENLDGMRQTLDHVFNRLTLGIIIGAMIIGSTMVITTGVGPLLFGFPALGIIGYIISAILGLWLVFSIIRTRRF
jgi:ubiquinone biosynthesis protein